MTTFSYRASTPDGHRVTGTRRARTLGDARREIASRGLHSVDLEERRRWWNTSITRERIATSRLHHLLRQLSVFVRGGVPIIDALQVLRDETDDRVVRRSLGSVLDDIRAGASLAAALARRPELLRPHHLGVVRAAEDSGRLADALADVETDLVRELEMRRSLRSAAAYPAIVVTLAAVTVGVLTVVVMPRFELLFDDLDADLPPATRILLDASRVLGSLPAPGWIGVLAVIATIAVVSASRPMRPLRHRIVLRTPGIGGFVRLAALERMCRVMSSSVRSGVPLPSAVAAATDAVGNVVLRDRIRRAQERILAGQGLSRAFADVDVLTPAVRQMIAVGESTGTVASQLELAGEHIHDELHRRLASATSLIEPALIVAVGIVVGFVAIALVSAMYGLIGDMRSDIP